MRLIQSTPGNTQDLPINNSVPSNPIRDLARIPLANLSKDHLKENPDFGHSHLNQGSGGPLPEVNKIKLYMYEGNSAFWTKEKTIRKII